MTKEVLFVIQHSVLRVWSFCRVFYGCIDVRLVLGVLLFLFGYPIVWGMSCVKRSRCVLALFWLWEVLILSSGLAE